MFSEGGGLQECVLAQVKTVPGRADQSGREQIRAERAPICAPIPDTTKPRPLLPFRQVTPVYPSTALDRAIRAIVLTRMRSCARTRAYVSRTAEGKAARETAGASSAISLASSTASSPGR
jgi:hypothetical protein